MKIHKLHQSQRLPISREDAWKYFSDPKKLNDITPDSMNFDITNDVADDMYPGMIITYKLTPLAGIKMQWVTEITHVEEGRFFVDEQRFGPYRFWHHQHHFKEIPGGVQMDDIVHYVMPLGVLGSAAHLTAVRRKLKQIFRYRYKKLEKEYGTI